MNDLADLTSSDSVVPGPRKALDTADVAAAYSRWARIYDVAFGRISSIARKAVASEINRFPGERVLEVGVGTGLALPFYNREKKITGIDLSKEMLAFARARVQREGLENVQALECMNAEQMRFADNSFDIGVAMFVASVAPNPRRLYREMRRVVKPGGQITFVNHFRAAKGLRWKIERLMAKSSHFLGWHPDFAVQNLFPEQDIPLVKFVSLPPGGIFTMAALTNNK